MKLGTGIVLIVEILLLALYAASLLVLTGSSRDFVLASRANVAPELQLGDAVSFTGANTFNPALVGGWTGPESWGTWADGGRAELALRLPAAPATVLSFDGRLFLFKDGTQRVRVNIDSRPVATIEAKGAPGIATCTWSIPVPAAHAALTVISFDIAHAVRPAEEGVGTDLRRLGLGLSKVTASATATAAHCDTAAIEVTPAS